LVRDISWPFEISRRFYLPEQLIPTSQEPDNTNIIEWFFSFRREVQDVAGKSLREIPQDTFRRAKKLPHRIKNGGRVGEKAPFRNQRITQGGPYRYSI
jgi:hypothetical protein